MFEKDNRTLQNPKQLEKNYFFYSPSNITIEPASNKIF